MDAADCKQAACCFYKYTKRIFMLKHMININFNNFFLFILRFLFRLPLLLFLLLAMFLPF